MTAFDDYRLNITLPDGRVIDRPHPEYLQHETQWRWLLDSYEAGDTYKDAVYGVDGFRFPIRNLIRHKREYPGPMERNQSRLILPIDVQGGWGIGYATDDYEMRRARTPVPKLLSEVVGQHLS